ncbi:MAG: hypothetical protein ACTSU5_19075 [Promethearchaeota archaeon]
MPTSQTTRDQAFGQDSSDAALEDRPLHEGEGGASVTHAVAGG